MCEIKLQVIEEISYRCKWCNNPYINKFDAYRCALHHAKTNLANTMLNQGFTLEEIEDWCGYHWKLTEKQKNITKDNCFIFYHWQCCEKPAYKITEIEKGGLLRLWGMGGSEGYGHTISLDRLPDPHPKEEYYSYK